MMREPLKVRDQREITVAGEARPTRPATASRRRPLPRTGAAAGEMRAAIGAFGGGLVTLCRQHPGEVAGSLVAVAAAAFVALNALGFQVGRHPAPILPKIATRQEPPGRKPAPDRPAPQAQGPVQGTAQAATMEKPGAKPETRPETRPLEAKAAEPAPRDPIAALIRSEDTTASVTPKADKAVMQAQRALSKLGYGPLKADGMMGTNTRAAIEKFERDRKLPVKGEAAGRTLRELAARAGLPPG
ncbi:peptidoglycan-binding domain-containing protein [Methylobacterium soli]